MGYCMEQRDCNFKIKREHFKDALKAIKALVAQDNKKSGGSFKGGKTIEKFFAWTENDEILNAKTVMDALLAWRWEVEIDDDGINNISFTGEKLGDDIHLFEAIAPFVEVGSYIEMTGEDGGHWRWMFNGKTCIGINSSKTDWRDKIDWGNKQRCFNHCPKCNAVFLDIEWGDKDCSGTTSWQIATCKKCGCEFTEIYKYSHTEIDALIEEDKKETGEQKPWTEVN